MRANIIRVVLILAAIVIAYPATCSELTLAGGQRVGRASGLGGTSWKLVKLQDGDGATSVPDDGSKYTITFGTDGRVSSRVDCNRGGSTWKLGGPNELKFGSWSMTRAKCPPVHFTTRSLRRARMCAPTRSRTGTFSCRGCRVEVITS